MAAVMAKILLTQNQLIPMFPFSFVVQSWRSGCFSCYAI